MIDVQGLTGAFGYPHSAWELPNAVCSLWIDGLLRRYASSLSIASLFVSLVSTVASLMIALSVVLIRWATHSERQRQVLIHVLHARSG
jgi:hypothetical protein